MFSFFKMETKISQYGLVNFSNGIIPLTQQGKQNTKKPSDFSDVRELLNYEKFYLAKG
jgi:hypothetical protein